MSVAIGHGAILVNVVQADSGDDAATTLDERALRLPCGIDLDRNPAWAFAVVLASGYFDCGRFHLGFTGCSLLDLLVIVWRIRPIEKQSPNGKGLSVVTL